MKPQTSVAQKTKPAGPDELKPFYEGLGEDVLEAHADDVIGEEVEEEIARSVKIEKKSNDITYDIPIVMNEMVAKWVNYFQTSGRKYFSAWLARSGKYIPMMKQILKENGLPQDLVYLSMIESGFKPYAYSHAKASGPWQFIRSTGMRYGLRSDSWIDERRDPEKSTIAAAQHLKDLYDQFDHWYLAAASYNAGSGKIQRAIQRYSTEDFWEMSEFKYLKPETKNYVPKIIAAALLAKNPEKNGFTDIQYEEPLQYSKVIVPEFTSLNSVATNLGIPLATLKELNPELKRGVTPPHYPNYELKIPFGMEPQFALIKNNVQISKGEPERIAGFHTTHKVRSGENLSQIADQYNVSVTQLKNANRLKSLRIHVGQKLRIPSRGEKIESDESVQTSGVNRYRVRRGDTLWSISRKFGVSVSQIRSWNKISSSYDIQAGQSLLVKHPKEVTDPGSL